MDILRDAYGIPHIFAASHSGGQSGNRLSEHYASFTQAWADSEYVPMITDRHRIEAAQHHTLRLVPAR